MNDTKRAVMPELKQSQTHPHWFSVRAPRGVYPELVWIRADGASFHVDVISHSHDYSQEIDQFDAKHPYKGPPVADGLVTLALEPSKPSEPDAFPPPFSSFPGRGMDTTETVVAVEQTFPGWGVR